MGYGFIAVLVIIFALLFLGASVLLLSNRHWIKGFIRGVAGIGALGLSVGLLLVAQDLFGFNSLKPGQMVLTLSARQTAPDQYAIEITEANGNQNTARIEGEQWQMEVRMFYWTPILKALGFRTGYQLDNIRGRYLMYDRQMKSKDIGTSLHDPSHLVDVWAKVRDGLPVPGLTASMVSPGFIRVADGAIYEVMLSGTELVANPVNDAAKAAQSAW